MKKYVKNKNFIPEDFINKLDSISDKKENRLIILLIIINLFILPNTIVKIANKVTKDNSVAVVAPIEYKEVENKTNKLKLLIKSINNNIKAMEIKNNSGYIEVDSIENIDNIEKESKLNIDSIDINEGIITMEVNI